MIVERLAGRHQRDEPSRRIRADAREERVARDDGTRTEVPIPVRRPADAHLIRRVAVQLHGLLLHDVVPDDEAIGAPDGNQLVGEVVPARVDDDRPDAAADGGSEQRDFGKDQARARPDEQHRLIPIEELLGPWMRNHPVDDVIARRPAENRRRDDAGQQPLGANPADRLLRDRLFAPDLHRLADAGVEIARLNQRHQPAFEARRHVRRQIFERDARALELLHERGVPDERRDDHDLTSWLASSSRSTRPPRRIFPAETPLGMETKTFTPVLKRATTCSNSRQRDEAVFFVWRASRRPCRGR